MSIKYFLKSFKIVLFSLLAFILFFNFSFAETKVSIPTFADFGNMLRDFDQNIVQNGVVLLSGLALVIFLAGLVKFIYDRAKGNEKDLKKDKEGILWSLGALFILVTLWGIIVFFQDTLQLTQERDIRIPRICVGDSCGQVQSQDPASNVGKTEGGGTFSEKDPENLLNTEVDGRYTLASVRSWPPEFGLGDEGSFVAQLQQFLKDKSGASLTVTGKFDDNTLKALQSFQKNNKLAETQKFNASVKAVILFKYLNEIPDAEYEYIASWSDLSFGSQSEYVGELQNLLIDYGCSVSGMGIDKKFGENTEQAVKNFQYFNFLKQDGIVGPSTRAVLMSTETKNCKI